jgi:hypothetical protein
VYSLSEHTPAALHMMQAAHASRGVSASATTATNIHKATPVIRGSGRDVVMGMRSSWDVDVVGRPLSATRVTSVDQGS